MNIISKTGIEGTVTVVSITIDDFLKALDNLQNEVETNPPDMRKTTMAELMVRKLKEAPE